MQLGHLLPRDRQLRRPRRVLAPGGRPRRARRAGAAVGRRPDARSHWMAPDGAAGRRGARAGPAEPLPDVQPGDVVVEAFGCDPPAGLRRSAWRSARARAGVDQPRVPERRGLRRAQPRPALAAAQRLGRVTKWFFYPGFTPRTGGLLREPGALWPRGAPPLVRRSRASAAAGRAAGQPVLLCRRAADALLDLLATRPTLLLTAPAPPGAGAGRDRAGRSGASARPRPALADAARLRPPAVVVRPELRARRGLLRARALGRRAVRLAHLSAARRRARAQARGLPRPHRRPTRRCGAVARLERPGRRGRRRWPDEPPWREACRHWRDDPAGTERT